MEHSKICIPLNSLSAGLLRSILEIYRDVVGGNVDSLAFGPASPTMEMRVEEIRYGLSRSNAVEWRFGSDLPEDLTKDGKLFVWLERKGGVDLVRFDFDPNVVDTCDARRMRREFRLACSNLLIQTGNFVEL